jgi:hypothetical protein
VNGLDLIWFSLEAIAAEYPSASWYVWCEPSGALRVEMRLRVLTSGIGAGRWFSQTQLTDGPRAVVFGVRSMAAELCRSAAVRGQAQ